MNRHRMMLIVACCLLVIACLMRPAASVSVNGARIYEPPENSPQAALAVPWIEAKGAALMDVGSYRLLVGKNSHQRLPMASTTKVMTAILAIESGRLQDTVVVSKAACQVEPSAVWLFPGERIKLSDLVYGLMLRSGNDAAIAIAEYLGGTVAGFAEQMNAKAAELGLLDTHFINPHGLPDPAHYTSAYDLAKIAAYALQNPQFSEVVSTRQISLPWDQHDEPRVWINKNRLLDSYPGADGVKTGWTRAAGYCLVASASRAGSRVVAVVLNSPDEFAETARLMDYAFDNYQPATVIVPGQFVQSVAVAGGHPSYVGAVAVDGYSWPLAIGETLSLAQQVVLPELLVGPVLTGQCLGTLRLLRAGECVAEIPLVADQSAFRGWWQPFLTKIVDRFWRLVGLATGEISR